MTLVRVCCEGGFFGPGCHHDHCGGYRVEEVDESVLPEEPKVDEDDWALGPVCSVEHEECESCQ